MSFIMKVLEVGSLHSGIDEFLDKIGTQKEQMNQIKEAVTNLIALEDSLKGAGGNAIRGFYEECHKPFLLFYENFLVEYEQTLNTIKSSLTGLEPSNNGFIRQSFLEQELNNGLNHTKSVTMELTDEANRVMDSVSDIVALPHLQDQSFLESAEEAKKEKDRTIERLLEFDLQQTKSLDTVEQDIESMNQYITHIASLFKSGDLQVGDYKTGQLAENLSCFNTTGLNKLLSYGQPVQISSDKMMINGEEMELPQLEQQEYGKEVEGPGGWQEGLSNVLDFVPIASNIKGGVEALFGEDFITGREIGDVERGILVAAIVGGPLVKAGVKAGKWGMKGIKWINAHYGDDVVKGLMKVKNALHPDRVKAVAKNATDSIGHTISQVKDFTKGIGKKIRDYELPGLEFVTNNGVKLSDNKTVGEVVDRTKENILRFAKKVESAVVGKVDGKKGVGGKGEVDKTYSRPSGFRKGVRDEVWEKATDTVGNVRDPLTDTIMNKGKSWDMGHKPGFEFRKHQQSAMERGITRKEFLNEHNNPDHYRPELPSSNRGHKGEDLTDDYFGD